ncbi:MAG: hypothetical protein Tsb0032_24340 [Kiloniellaceae bacterium]
MKGNAKAGSKAARGAGRGGRKPSRVLAHSFGKGGMGPETTAGCAENKAVHAVFPGGCAVLAATKVEEIEGAEWTDLGMPETLWINKVRDFGPLIISIDTKGNNLFQQNKERLNAAKKPILDRIKKELSFIR